MSWQIPAIGRFALMSLAAATAFGVWGVPSNGGHDLPAQDIPKIVTETAKLFQNGNDRVDVRQAEELLLAVGQACDLEVRHDKQSEEFYIQLEKFLDYVDGHQFHPSDMLALRERLASSLRCDDDHSLKSRDVPARRVSWAIRAVWPLAQEAFGKCKPRHAVLCSVLGVWPGSFSQLRVCAQLMQAKESEEKAMRGEVEYFLQGDERKALWVAVVAETAKLKAVSGMNEQFVTDELLQNCLKKGAAPEDVDRELKTFIVMCERLLLAVPDYDWNSIHGVMTRLRVAWNIAHAVGTNAAVDDLKACLGALREKWQKNDNALMLNWVDQVMLEPGPPPAVHLKRFKLVPVNPSATK